MGPDFYLKSIARTVTSPDNKFARKKDCHSTTARYIKSDAAKDSDLIVMAGPGYNKDVYHSFVVSAAGDIVSDSFPGYKRVKFDPKSLNTSYKGNIDDIVDYVPIETLTIGDFKNKYKITEDTKVNFKKFLMEESTKLTPKDIKPTKEVEGDQAQLKALRQFGAKLQKLVEKYAEFNVENTSTHAGYYGAAKLSASRSGKIEFRHEHTSGGGQYTPQRTAWCAVLIGSNYPTDKAEAFTKELAKLAASTLPTHIPFQPKEGPIRPRKVWTDYQYGTNYSTFGVYF